MMTETTARSAGHPAGEPETATAPLSAEEAKIAALVEALSKEVAELKDKHLRTLAEMENSAPADRPGGSGTRGSMASPISPVTFWVWPTAWRAASRR